MREIKFRAWDSNEGRMWSHAEIDASDKDGIVMWGEIFNKKEGGFAVMQFTGLRDKNGVEIFEGDIVDLHQFLFDGSEVECESRGVIGYSGSSFTLSKITSEWLQQYTGYKAGEGEFPLYDFTPIDAHYGLHDESFTVIGNIHQHPELLEAK